MDLHWQPIPSFAFFVKRVFDIALSIMGIVIALPLLVFGIVSITLIPEGRCSTARRAGQKGRIFICYKLRTMVTNADELKETLRDRNERQGPFFKIAHDPRVTRTGRFLRKYSLDELPQLWNVIKGDMSLVGPRPSGGRLRAIWSG